MKWSYMAVFLTIGVIVFFSCRKMLSDVSIDKMALSESIQKVKAEFVKLDYSALFVENRLNDTSTVFK
ncbi:MAG: hypothetical protein JWQ30_230 [Sediminibacterium sp.]|nr:hypothetical protein [Sediminibacterium sp.]